MKKLLLVFFCVLAFAGAWIHAQSPTAVDGWGGAAWVWDEPSANKVTQSNEPRYLRQRFDLTAKPAQADLWITADNHYTAYLNGHKVGADGEWASVEKYDVAKYLTPGKNVLAIEARNQGGVAGVIARMRVTLADNKNLFVVTNQKTKMSRAKAGARPGADWLKSDFDDSSWFAAIELGDAGLAPWHLVGAGAPPVTQGIPGKGKNYGSSAVDPKIKTRLSAQEQLKHFIVSKDFEIELVAADPVVINPITMVLDDKGRIIVSESHTYRYGPPGSPIKPFANPVIRLDPDGKGGLTRTLLADGFDDPVMGIAIKADPKKERASKLWLTANNYLYRYDLDEKLSDGKKGLATNKKTLVTDLSKAWNPFGMFVLEWGPDGKLYMSVGNHAINLQGPDGKMGGRGSSGIVVRLNPDGSQMERLVHGLRVPYSFEYDPFGQLWLLSNGEGNPDRFVRVIDGVDYHCYSRGEVDNNWLAGNNPLAPPCDEVHGGAHTQLMRYFGAAYPKEYQGNLFCCNWGRHGFSGPNRGIFRFVLDEHNNVIMKDTLVACTDPHFRPSHIILDADGSLLIADWYGRDDESDMTGRIWRLKHVGKNAPLVKHRLDSPEWQSEDYAIEALGSPSHLVREKAVEELVRRGNEVVNKVADHAAKSDSPLGAAHAIWTLLRIDTSPGKSKLFRGIDNPDWRVRRLALNIARRYNLLDLSTTESGGNTFVRKLDKLSKDADPAVRLETALIRPSGDDKRRALLDTLEHGAASDVHLRYEAAWHLAKCADEKAITKLLTSDDADLRLAGLIAIDVACYENFNTRKLALAALGKALENPAKLDHQMLLTVAQLDGDASIVPALEKMLARNDLPTATVAKAVLVMKAKSGGLSKNIGVEAGKRLVEAVQSGTLKIASPADQLVLFEFLESEGPTPFALGQIGGQLRSKQAALRLAAHSLARRFGTKSASLVDPLWPSVLSPKTKFDEVVDALSTIARIEETPRKDAWEKMLSHADPLVRAEAVRWWRSFDKQPDMVDVLVSHAPALMKNDENIKDDLATVMRHLNRTDTIQSLHLPEQEKDKDSLTKYALKELAGMSDTDRTRRAVQGLQVFERNACTKCHTTATQTTALAPSLKGIAAQKVDYLVESVLYPSKIIKTGFESETLITTGGKTLTGLVKDEGKFLRVLNLDREERIAKSDVESRSVSRVSIMPEGQETTLSRREFVDLIVYLSTLK